MLNQLLQPFQIGDIYISLTETNPASKFGGVWEKIEDTFLLASSDRYSVGSTGGEAEHTLTITEMPSHTHEFKGMNVAPSNGGTLTPVIGSASDAIVFDQQNRWNYKRNLNTGDSQAHNNMPPYLAVYMYKKVA